jgi:hypothetical protein
MTDYLYGITVIKEFKKSKKKSKKKNKTKSWKSHK